MAIQKITFLCGICEKEYASEKEARKCEYSHIKRESPLFISAQHLHSEFCHLNRANDCGFGGENDETVEWMEKAAVAQNFIQAYEIPFEKLLTFLKRMRF